MVLVAQTQNSHKGLGFLKCQRLQGILTFPLKKSTIWARLSPTIWLIFPSYHEKLLAIVVNFTVNVQIKSKFLISAFRYKRMLKTSV